MFDGNTIIIQNLEKYRQNKLFLPPDDSKWTDNTLLQMGYPSLDHSNARVVKMVHESIDALKSLCSPTFLFKTQALSGLSKSGIQTQSFQIESLKWRHVASKLSGIQFVCCFALTLGPECEEKMKALGPNEIMLTFIWDALLSTLAEHFAGQAETYIAYLCNTQGLLNTRRFSPGYCDLNLIQGQSAIFKFCQPEKIGIHLNDGGLMIPRKSVTAFVLIAETMVYKYPCSFCRQKCDHCLGKKGGRL
jgi:hypothetical protein